MRAIVIALSTIFAAAVMADVSHLATSYLPPSSFGTTTTTIEKQELHELPEQIEYAVAEQQTNMALRPMQMMPMLMHMQQMMPIYYRKETMNPSGKMLKPLMTAAHYLPPPQIVASKHQQQQKQQHQQQKPRQQVQNIAAPLSQKYFASAINTHQLQQSRLALPIQQAEAHMPHEPTRNSVASYYMPPSMMMQQMSLPIPTYKQYQEQLMQTQQQMQPTQLLNVGINPMKQQLHQLQHQYMLQAIPEQHIATDQREAEPAHVLAEDGYHYRTGISGRNDMHLQFIQ